MSLQRYRAKRKFQQTTEPKGTLGVSGGPLRFVVQKHRASHLHYDLRLETDGTLKSWAVPKGPSPNPHDKRLAMMVEDHPLDYLHFEGIIPKGNYGAGTVMVWDEGTYHVPGVANRQESERIVREGLRAGRFSFVLHGKKLRGEFAIVKTQRAQENAWLLMKKRDDVADNEEPDREDDRSVLTGRTMEEISAGRAPRGPRRLDLSKAPKAAMPRNVAPMLAMPVDEPFDRPCWIFEVKWDGYRAIAEVEKGKVRLYSRSRLSFVQTFAAVVDSLQHLGHDAVLDGEIVVVDQTGHAHFQMLQQYQKTRAGRLLYYVFDLLYLDGHDLQSLPLRRRKEILAEILDPLPHVALSEHIEEHGVAFFDAVSQRGLEGVVAKDATSRYRQGRRSQSWLKIKTHLCQEAVIGGFTEPKGSRQGLGSLVLGVYEHDKLKYIGHAGSGLAEQVLADLRSRLEPLVQTSCPFEKRPKVNAPVHWVQPKLVCEVSFAAWTKDGHLRHPIFRGLREDKDAESIRRERPQPANSVLPNGTSGVPKQRSVKGTARTERISGHVVHLSNLDKVYWPQDGYTKGDLIGYYREVSAFILPHLKDRPQSLHRHPNGIDGKSFFQKDVSQQPPPDWVRTVELVSDADGKRVRSVLCQDEATLVYLANLGCVELNPWNSRVGTLDWPDCAVLDLDPEGISFDHVVETAQAVRKVLHRVGAEAFCKTSGKRGLHVYVPFGARYSHDQAKSFTELIARVVNSKLPFTTSLVRSPSGRQGRVYLDYLQNGKGKTLAAAYSVRPWTGATVSAPLKWSEVKHGLDPERFTMRTMAKRLHRVGDLWQPVLGPGIDLPKCLERLASVL